jgi:hypothetical protein
LSLSLPELTDCFVKIGPQSPGFGKEYIDIPYPAALANSKVIQNKDFSNPFAGKE